MEEKREYNDFEQDVTRRSISRAMENLQVRIDEELVQAIKTLLHRISGVDFQIDKRYLRSIVTQGLAISDSRILGIVGNTLPDEQVDMLAREMARPTVMLTYTYRMFTKEQIRDYNEGLEKASSNPPVAYTHHYAVAFVAFYKLVYMRRVKTADATWIQFLFNEEPIRTKDRRTAELLCDTIPRAIHAVADTSMQELTQAFFARDPYPNETIDNFFCCVYYDQMLVLQPKHPERLTEHMCGMLIRARLVASTGWPLHHYQEHELYDFLMQLI